MTFDAKKIELAKRILETNDKDIISHVQAVFETEEGWLDEYPEEVQKTVKKSIDQFQKGESMPDKEVKKMAKKWLKK